MRCKPSEMVKQRKGLWYGRPMRTKSLTYYVMNHGHGRWSFVPINAGLQRSGKSCRLRWVNYLRPGIKRGTFSSQEEETILTLHGLLGNKWSQISKHLPGRTDNEIKNYWHSQVRPIGDDTNSNMLNRDPSSPSLNTFKSTNSLSGDMDQSVPPVSQSSHLPKVLFADWISLDEFQQDFGMSSDKPLSRASIYQQGTAEYEWQRNEGSAASYENRNCVNSCSDEVVLHTEMTIDQIFNIDVEDFNIDDFMYM